LFPILKLIANIVELVFLGVVDVLGWAISFQIPGVTGSLIPLG
jgi:hypothetical protein